MSIADDERQTVDAWPDTAPPDVGPDELQAPAAPSRLARAARLAVRALLWALVALGALVAVALVLTPPRQSVLILGSDARPDELAAGQRGRTDTLMLLVADRAEPLAATVSIPRDLWVTIAGGYGQERINAALELGGPAAAKSTVGAVLGQPVDHYALIGLQGVRDVVDAVGGVDIVVDEPIHDAAYPTDDYGIITIDIPAGRQHMDGETALEYARTRHQDSDFGRAGRQQRVLAAVRSALLNPLNWWRLPAVAAAGARWVQTDVSPLDASAVAAALMRAGGDPDRLVIDTQLTQPIIGADGAYLLQPTPALKPAVARFLRTAPTSVEVLNGAGVPGAARAAADRLAGQGFAVERVGNAAAPQPRTTLSARPAARSTAEALARALGLPADRVSTAPDLPANVDVQVVVGGDLAAR
jgi:polyisoprenyl-teichoic acid--peptidoglycan teichoic acid transferase